MTKHSQVDKYVGNLGDGNLYAFQVHASFTFISWNQFTIINAYYIELTIYKYRFTPYRVIVQDRALAV